MRDGAFTSRQADDRCVHESTPGRTGHNRFAPGNYRWLGLLLVLAIVMPWPSSHRSGPPMKPSRRAAGSSPVPLVSLAFGADGQTLATTDEAGLATLWRAGENWSPVPAFKYRGHAKVVEFSADGRHLAIGGQAPHVALYDLERANWEQSPQISVRSTSQLKISPDGQTLAVSSHDSPEIVLWDLVAGRARSMLRGHSAPVMHMAFAPDGQSLASAAGTSDRPIIIWNLATGRPDRRITALSSALQALAYSPDSKFVAGACPHERAVRIWDVKTGIQVQVIAGHAQSTRSLVFSPDGRLLATGAGDGTAALWSVATGHEIKRLDAEADVVKNIAFSPDGHSLAATANDGEIRIWDLGSLVANRTDD
jgi:WD40 repeat protein